MTDSDRYDLVLSPDARRALTEQLLQPAAFACRARHGEYRVRYEINDEQHLVSVVDIDHRRDVYRT